ncbi:glycosyltransferase family 2 protein [Aeromonas veronii]
MLSVIIPVWKRYVELELILKRLNEQAQKFNITLEVVLCDSYSGCEMDDLVARSIISFHSLLIIHAQTKNILSTKRNVGVSKSSGEYLVFLDDDCIPNGDFLCSIFNIIDSFDTDTVYCGEVRFENELVNDSNYYRYRDSKHPVYSEESLIFFNEWTAVAMNCLISRETLCKYNVCFNDSFIGYGCEDHEFFHALILKGVKVKFSKQKIYHHEYGGDISKYSGKMFSTARDGMFTLLKASPEMLIENKKLRVIEKIASNNTAVYKFFRNVIFNKKLCDFISDVLIKKDKEKMYYIPFLYKYVLVCHYIYGVSERNAVDRKKVVDNWYV